METGKKWLEEHLETFVKPVLGMIPNLPSAKEGSHINQWYNWSDPKVMACLKAAWKEGKKLAGSKRILLPGRDVWEFEVLARLEGHPTIFRPDISSAVAPHVEEDYTDCCCIDTGFMGSVPKAMKIKDFRLISYMPDTIKTVSKTRLAHQIFPYMAQMKTCKITGKIVTKASPLSQLVDAMEGVYKYWNSAIPDAVYDSKTGNTEIIKPLKVIQTIAPVYQFTQAAQLTQLIAKSCL